MHRLLRVLAILSVLPLCGVALPARADAPGNPAFQRTWAHTDQPVLDGAVARTWIWGPAANTPVVTETYTDAPGSVRDVQYYDKSRMEINDPNGDPNTPFYVTNGLLVVELMSGRLQLGDNQFEQHQPAQVNVAGDPGDPLTYADLAPLRSAPPVADGSVITQRVDANGAVSDDPSLAGQGVTAAYHVTLPGIDHQVASPFWDFLNSSGPVEQDGQLVNERLFDPWFYATGLPVTEAYWATVQVGGTPRLVLLQCFERRCLTYTPGNPAGFLVEAGNVGQHYHAWRYEQIPAESAATDYAYAYEWGDGGFPLAPLHGPYGLGLDASDHLWVADTGNNRLVVFYADGSVTGVLGASGTGPSQFDTPNDVAFGDNGRMYVLDAYNERVQVFTDRGDYMFQWGSAGSGDGQFVSPSAIVVYHGVVYVVDYGLDRVQMFTLEGQYVGQFGSHGSGDGQFDKPAMLAIDDTDTVYVTDSNNNRVQMFTMSGSYVGQFGSRGSGDGQFNLPWGIAVDQAGDLYVVDRYNQRVQKLTPAGSYLSQWGAVGSGFGQFNDPSDIALDSHGDIYIADSQNNRIQKFTSNGTFLFDVYDARRGYMTAPIDIATDQNGNLLVIDGYDDIPSVSRYTPDAVPLDSFGRGRHDAREHELLHGLAVNAAGDIYITEHGSNRVQRFSSSWAYLGEWGATGSGPGQFTNPTAIEVDADGNVYVADSDNNRIQKFDAGGTFLAQWGSAGAGAGQFNDPEGIAIQGEHVYVSDYGNDRVEVFDRAGHFITQWGHSGSGLGELREPVGVEVTPAGYVLVVDYGNSRVEIFTADGNAVGAFGSAGSDPGQFNVAFGIAVGADGSVYVTDIGNHRVQKFTPVR